MVNDISFLYKICDLTLTLFRMGYFGAAHGWGGGDKKFPFPKICYTYTAMMKLATLILFNVGLLLDAIAIINQLKVSFTLLFRCYAGFESWI